MSDMTDDLDWGEFDGDDGYSDRARCKYCGKDEFYWGVTDSGSWRLFRYEDGALHVCQKYPHAALAATEKKP